MRVATLVVVLAACAAAASAQSRCALLTTKADCGAGGGASCTWCTTAHVGGGFCFATSGGACPTGPTARPTLPVGGFTVAMNVTAVAASGASVSALEEIAMDVKNGAGLISILAGGAGHHTAGSRDLTTHTGADKACTSAHYHTATRDCHESCHDGTPCNDVTVGRGGVLATTAPPPPPPPNASCGCGVSNIFLPVSYAVYDGPCGADDKGDVWLFAQGTGKQQLKLLYCFDGDTPVSLTEYLPAQPQADARARGDADADADGMRAPMYSLPHHAAVRGGAAAAGAATSDDDDAFKHVVMAFMYVARWEPTTPPAATFALPDYCQCKQ